MMQHRSRSRQGRQGRCHLMAAGWPEVAETYGINEATGITRELCQRDDVSIAASSTCDAEPRASACGSIRQLHPSLATASCFDVWRIHRRTWRCANPTANILLLPLNTNLRIVGEAVQPNSTTSEQAGSRCEEAATSALGLGLLLYPSRRQSRWPPFLKVLTDRMLHPRQVRRITVFPSRITLSAQARKRFHFFSQALKKSHVSSGHAHHSELRRLPFTAIGDPNDRRHLRHTSVLLSIC